MENEEIKTYLNNLKQKTPLIHCITNYVTVTRGGETYDFLYKFDPMDFETRVIKIIIVKVCSINLILWILKQKIQEKRGRTRRYKFDPMDFETKITC
ncbi:hypothetical protein HMPREF9309_01454 [Campylobacter ureolyticus ACS-301-V-Sch3b]|uniref:Uncharacterized protein n=1 Tax=Campylobacter ureolyticus ACS-301-V-Sch3b TaxID=883165 RepID=S3XQB0_9BACT|nr:hypothetical protein HMPREF9309_01454 [Campylobacter ureolyticus ACS-301-V-Sch3b]